MNIVIGSPLRGGDIVSRMRALRHGSREDRIQWLTTVEWLIDDAVESLRLLRRLRAMSNAPPARIDRDYADVREALDAMIRMLRAERTILNMLPAPSAGDTPDEARQSVAIQGNALRMHDRGPRHAV